MGAYLDSSGHVWDYMSGCLYCRKGPISNTIIHSQPLPTRTYSSIVVPLCLSTYQITIHREIVFCVNICIYILLGYLGSYLESLYTISKKPIDIASIY